MNYFFQPDILNDITYLDPEESNHCIRVLRKKPGDVIKILDGKGGIFTCKIIKADPTELSFQMLGKKQIASRDYSIHIAIAPTKNLERMEWFVEKSVEIGIDKISFIQCRNSERKIVKLNRLEKKAISAMKQSGNLYLPVLSEIMDVNQFIKTDFGNTLKFIGHSETGSSNPLITTAKAHLPYLVLIGPEGDFTLDEVLSAKERGFLPVSLGSSRLRTETAGLLACSILNLINSQAG